MTPADVQLFGRVLHAGIPVHVSSLIPLHRSYPPTGAVMADRLCVRTGGRLIFHPQRFAEFKAALAREAAGTTPPSAGEFARWDDDGGGPRT